MRLAKRCVACDGDRLGHVPAVLMPFLADRIFGWRPTEITSEWGLRDVPPGMACSICKTMMCEDCGMLFLDMRFDDEEMAALYADYRGEAYTTDRDRFEPGYAARNAIMLEGSAYIGQIEVDSGALPRREAARARLGRRHGRQHAFSLARHAT